MAKKTHNCLLHLLKHLHIKAQLLPFTQKAKCCSLRGNPHQDKLRLRATLHNIVWHGLYILYTQMQWHTIGLINPPALVHSIDYESQPLIRGGLNRAAALKEVTLGWLTPSHTLWSQGVTTGKTVCASLRVSMHLLMAQTGPLSEVGYVLWFWTSVITAESAGTVVLICLSRDLTLHYRKQRAASEAWTHNRTHVHFRYICDQEPHSITV